MALATPFELISHSTRVCRLYKAALLNCKNWNADRLKFRIEATLLRARFDEHKNEKNLIKAKQLVIEGEKELEKNLHPSPFYWPYSNNGGAFEREVTPPDWCLDFWDPIEKAQYPYYFARREQRKKEYVQLWEKKNGKPNLADYNRFTGKY